MTGTPWKLAGYLVEGLLGRGGSGEVWRARSVGGDPVALKRIAFDDADQIRAARAEAALLATLDHPHLIRLHELVPTADAVVLVLDLAAGGSLADLLGKRGRLTPGEVITAVAPIGAALAYAHAAGVVHGDVTPANVLFTEAGYPLLADLGVARLLGDHDPVRSTPAYIDPAVAAGSVPGPQSDVFMLGAVALHALTGAPAWLGSSTDEAMAAAQARDLGDVAARLADAGAPESIVAVVTRALAVEPDRRGTAADFALDLRHAGEPVAVELAAGRARVEPSTAGPANREDGNGVLPVSAPGRPAFDRPETGAAASTAVYTHAVRPRPRPQPGRRRRTQSSFWERRRVRWVAAVVGAVGLAAGGTVAWGRLGDGGPTRAQAAVPSAEATVVGVGEVPVDPATLGSLSTVPAATVSTPSTAHVLTDAEAAAVLSQLDAIRERAFARRAPVLLTGVYVPGPLLDQDTALLNRLVPPGCGLEGVRTDYASVKVIGVTGDRIEMSVRATLAPSVLVCDGAAKAKAAGSGPTTLRIVLVRKRADYVFAAVGS